MPTCPICSTPLAITKHREGVFYPCATCDGRALTVPQTRRVFGDRIATKVLRLIKLGSLPGRTTCPFCTQPMLTVALQDPPLQVEACRPCSVLWFDAPSFGALPQIGCDSTSNLAMQSTDILALTRLKAFNAREEAERKQARQKTGFRRWLGRGGGTENGEKA